MTTGNLQLPDWVIHFLSLALAAIVFLSSNDEFLKLLSPTWVTLFHISGPLLTYLGVSQIAAKPVSK